VKIASAGVCAGENPLRAGEQHQTHHEQKGEPMQFTDEVDRDLG
jgi:hypothetical protein